MKKVVKMPKLSYTEQKAQFLRQMLSELFNKLRTEGKLDINAYVGNKELESGYSRSKLRRIISDWNEDGRFTGFFMSMNGNYIIKEGDIDPEYKRFTDEMVVAQKKKEERKKNEDDANDKRDDIQA
jgi:hypothetical protein